MLILFGLGCNPQRRSTETRSAQQIPAEYQGEYKDLYLEMIADLKRDFPFHAGMPVAKVQGMIKDNNARVDALVNEQFEQDKSRGVFSPPAFADRERHLYRYVDLSELKEMAGSFAPSHAPAISFWVNGRHQFFVDMAIKDDTVQNIYIAPGNFTVMLPAFCFDGTDKHVGRFNVYENMLGEQ